VSAIRKATEPVEKPEARIIYRRTRSTDRAVWHVSVNGLPMGTTGSMGDATTLLYENGYKVWAYRRVQNAKDQPEYLATLHPIKAAA
jgi:hypothetical protein